MKAWARRNPGISVLLIMIVFILGLLILSSILNRTSCAWYGYQTERDTRYAAFVGCMVQMHDAWVPRSEIRTQQ